MLEVQNLNYRLNGKTILENINFDVKKGEILSIIGPSGCGKTSILKAIAGIAKEHTGNIVLDQTDITTAPINKRDVTLVFQDFSLFPHMTLEQNMQVATNSSSDIEYVLSEMDINHLKGKYPHQMSGGEQQRASIARAIAHQPKLLLLDEPFSNVDAITTKKLRTKITQLIEFFKITTIMVTHDLDDVFAMSNRCVVMKRAGIIQKGTLEDIYNYPKNIFVAELFGDVLVFANEIYRPENIKIVQKWSIKSQKALVINVKFSKGYDEIFISLGQNTLVVYDYHRLGFDVGDHIYLEFGSPITL